MTKWKHQKIKVNIKGLLAIDKERYYLLKIAIFLNILLFNLKFYRYGKKRNIHMVYPLFM
jgi:hypothetical protein